MNRKPLTLTEIEALLRAGQLEEAHQSLQDFVKAEPDNPQGWYMLGNLYRRQQLWGDAINMLNKADEPCSFNLQLGEYFATIHLPANCVETIEVTLPE